MGGENRATALLAFDVEPAAVTLQCVLDDREAEAGAAFLAGPCAINTIEALREPWQVFRRDADAGVLHHERCTAVRASPADRDRAVDGRVLDRVRDQVRCN